MGPPPLTAASAIGPDLPLGGGRVGGPDPSFNPVANAPPGASSSPELQLAPAVGSPADSKTEAVLLRDTALARQLAGVAALARLDLLDRIARFRSTDMALRGYFSHIDPNGVTPFEVMRRMGARYGMASEIIAWNTTSGDAGPVAAVHGGLASIGHREAMLDERHRHAGIGVASDGGKRLYTIVFTD